MRHTSRQSTLSLALIATMFGSAAWSPDSHACSESPMISAVCIMAAVNLGSFNQTYAVANGATLNISQYQALFSLLGATYGGNGTTNFMLPDLRGRVVVGAGMGTGLPQFNVGDKGGQTAVTLTVNQLPAHNHALTSAAVDISRMTATTTLNNVSASVTGSLALKASSGGTSRNDPAGASLATTSGAALKIYSDAAPTVAMKAGSIDSSGLAVGNFSGNPTTSLGGTATVSGSTALTGAGQTVSTMPPYLAMNYYIAYSGTYPSRD